MGLDYNGVRLLAYTKALDPSLDSIVMLGRQSLHTDAAGIQAVFEEFRIPFEEWDPQRVVDAGSGYCEPLLQHMGFGRIESIDYSNYEHPTHVYDFNRPLPHDFDAGYDLVLDGGSLEHIFNFPIALRNCMRMVKPGGIFVTITPCNNLCGHGFYQFSPELYFSLMRGNNQFKLLDLFCHENGRDMTWHRVKDPDVIKSRVNLITRNPVMMLVIARRLLGAELPDFHIQQSDYQTLWAGESLKTPPKQNSPSNLGFLIRRIAAKAISGNLKSRIRELLEPDRFPSDFFTPAGNNKGSLLESALSARNQPLE